MVLKMVPKRFTGLLNRRPSEDDATAQPENDTPEANAARGVRLFCESGGAANSGEEVLHLPTIVEAAVASPPAAAAAAKQIRKFLQRENFSRPHVQYNAIMLIRILADNPGQSFTKNVDNKFVDTVKGLLRNCRDPSVQQITRETLEAIDQEKAYDTNLQSLTAMWRMERGAQPLAGPMAPPGQRTLNAPPWNPTGQQPGFGQNYGPARASKELPPPAELSARIEEARTSAKLLLQLVQSTPPSELLSNELVKEFAERCQQAQRSIQTYINADNPAPDDDTMLTLIETNEQLSLAASKHQRAILTARRATGQAVPSPPVSDMTEAFAPPTGPPPPQQPTQTSMFPPRAPAQAAPIAEYSAPPRAPPQSAPMADYNAAPRAPPKATPATSYNPPPPIPSNLRSGFANQFTHPDERDEAPDAPQIPPLPRHDEDDPFSDTNTIAQPKATRPARPAPSHVHELESPVGTLSRPNVGYQGTPSYLHRQESSLEHQTMHGANSPPPARDGRRENAADTVSTPGRDGHGRHSRTMSEVSDLSPVENRMPVTYRY